MPLIAARGPTKRFRIADDRPGPSVGYLPTAALPDKSASSTAGASTPVVAAAGAAGAWAVFQAGLRRHESAGS